MKKSIKVACYCRVSTGSQEQIDSFENQKQFFERYVKESNEYELYGIYADKGVSGTLMKRENFEKLLWDAGLDAGEYTYKKKPYNNIDNKEYEVEYKDYKIEFNGQLPKFEEILVKNTSRFARNIMVIEILRKLKELGVYVRFLDINKSTRNENDWIIIQFFQQFDEMFSADLSRKLLAANQQSKYNKVLRTNYDLLGYRYLPRSNRGENNKLIIIEDEAKIIRTIFKLYLGCYKIIDEKKPEKMNECNFKCLECEEYIKLKDTDGLGFRMIRYMLNNVLGYRTRKGKEFAQTTLKHIFDNEKYAGYINTGKWNHGTVFNKKATPQKREEYLLEYAPEIVQPIISKELFYLCTNKRLGKVSEDNRGVFKGKHTKYKGIIYCARCGMVYTHNISSDKKGYYNCKTKRQKGKQYCGNVNVFDWQIDEKVKELQEGEFNELIERENIRAISSLVEKINSNIKILNESNDKEIVLIKEELENDERALKDYYKRQAYGTANNKILEELIKELEDEEKTKREKLQKLTKEPKILIDEANDMLHNCYSILELVKNKKEIYTEDEILNNIEKFIIWGEPRKERGVWQTPEPVITPIIKGMYKPTTPIDLGVQSVVISLGVIGASREKEARSKLDNLKDELKAIETRFSLINKNA